MKIILCLFGLATTLFLTVGCESDEHHGRYHDGYGGTYEGSPYYGGYGSGAYQGYPNYPQPQPFPDHPYHGGY